MEFEFDLEKSAANHSKHGIDFVRAQILWHDPFGLEVGPFLRGEVRLGRIAKMEGRCYIAIFTRRGKRIRLISVRRARKDEVRRYEQTIR
jgi:uncharacterized DUF497 family protein